MYPMDEPLEPPAVYTGSSFYPTFQDTSGAPVQIFQDSFTSKTCFYSAESPPQAENLGDNGFKHTASSPSSGLGVSKMSSQIFISSLSMHHWQ